MFRRSCFDYSFDSFAFAVAHFSSSHQSIYLLVPHTFHVLLLVKDCIITSIASSCALRRVSRLLFYINFVVSGMSHGWVLILPASLSFASRFLSRIRTERGRAQNLSSDVKKPILFISLSFFRRKLHERMIDASFSKRTVRKRLLTWPSSIIITGWVLTPVNSQSR